MQGQTVVSKYFNKKVKMDDSLKDFQEIKKIKPRKVTKPPAKPIKKQPKRTIMKEKGQKDIRIVLKSEKNDLVNYSEEFKKVCLESGVDIDSEQLQVAVALSKSLKEYESQTSSTHLENSGESSTQNHRNKIRSTLLEYGFNMPEIKKKIQVKKKGRKCWKNSKLLGTTEEEKKQKIADKVSQILFDFNINPANVSIIADVSTSNALNVYKLTGQHFDLLKNDNYFYTADLVEVAPNTVGCLLKDWSKIPGRTASPPPVDSKYQNFTEYIDNQDDLDVLLSSTMEVVKRLVDALRTEKERIIETVNDGIEKEVINTEYDEIVNDIHVCKTDSIEEKSKTSLELFTQTTVRSYSPDLFEDEPSVEDHSRHPEILSYSEVKSDKNKSIPANFFLLNHPSHTNENKRISNDFMDLTGYVFPIKLKEHSQNLECEIDLTQNHNDSVTELNSNSLPVICVDDTMPIENDQNSQLFDLTQSSDTSLDALPCVHLSSEHKQSSYTNAPSPCQSVQEKEIIDNESADSRVNNNENLHFDSKIDLTTNGDNNELDLTQDSSSSEIISHTEKFEIIENRSGLFDDFVYRHSSTSENTSKETVTSINVEKETELRDENQEKLPNKNDSIDLTQPSIPCNEDYFPQNNQIGLNERNNIPDGISLGSSGHSIIDSLDKTIEYNNFYEEIKYDDLEQDAMADDDELNRTSGELMEKFAAKNEISAIPIVLDLSETDMSKMITERSPAKENSANIPTDFDLVISQCSGNVFEISDEELDYSMQYFQKQKQTSSETLNSRCSNPIPVNVNFDIVGSSILDQIPSNRPSTSNVCTPKHPAITRITKEILNDSLPAVEIKGTKVKIKTQEVKTNNLASPCTPISRPEGCSVFTPGNSEYIVKTSNVTPMADYDSFDTPQINKELDKFGLKPLKRKRAVQLLEHLYYQTHPIVETCDSGVESENKKPKKSHCEKIPEDSESLTELFRNSKTENVVDKKEYKENSTIYEIGDLRPVLKNIPCNEEDWIFQKREKTKVHGCKVPLHIVFHNYVSARPLLLEAILRYEPISIDIIHKQLVKDGHRYDPKDLLKFLDKKCITVKTAGSKNGGSRTRRR